MVGTRQKWHVSVSSGEDAAVREQKWEHKPKTDQKQRAKGEREGIGFVGGSRWIP